jgi:hypothetical protein
VDRGSDLWRSADQAQAEYFRKLIGGLRLEAESELAGLFVQLQGLSSSGERARSLRRVVRALQAETRSLDRMGEALQERFGSV